MSSEVMNKTRKAKSLTRSPSATSDRMASDSSENRVSPQDSGVDSEKEHQKSLERLASEGGPPSPPSGPRVNEEEMGGEKAVVEKKNPETPPQSSEVPKHNEENEEEDSSKNEVKSKEEDSESSVDIGEGAQQPEKSEQQQQSEQPEESEQQQQQQQSEQQQQQSEQQQSEQQQQQSPPPSQEEAPSAHVSALERQRTIESIPKLKLGGLKVPEGDEGLHSRGDTPGALGVGARGGVQCTTSLSAEQLSSRSPRRMRLDIARAGEKKGTLLWEALGKEILPCHVPSGKYFHLISAPITKNNDLGVYVLPKAEFLEHPTYIPTRALTSDRHHPVYFR